ncbi:MAG: hydantoin racemase [Deltaproteobacteria bacterium]|nr:hydantoin racemase [Deltaproteobacteria bacterium]MCL5891572.1 hydantoin racemase [Deltaproteobacteria bacterium]
MNPKYNGIYRYFFGCLSILISVLFIALSFYDSKQEFIIKSSFINFSFRFDALSLFFVIFISSLSIFISIFSIKYGDKYDKKPSLFFYSFFFIMSMIILVISNDMLTFLIFWELMSIFSFLLVIYDGSEEPRRAGFLYFLMTHIGTILITASFIMLYLKTSSFSFDYYKGAAGIMILAAAITGFSIKAGIMPFHTWLPYAHPVAPANISAIMSGIMVNMAIYGILKFLFVFSSGSDSFLGIILLVIGALSALLGIMYAMVQKDIKKLLAFSTIENMGIIFMGIGVSYWAKVENFKSIEYLAMLAVLLHVVNHGLSKSSLFMGSGLIDKYTHTRNMEKLGGLSKKMGQLSVLFLIGVMSISAMPPLNGFLSEWYLYISLIGSVLTNNLYMVYFSVIAIALLSLTGAAAGAAFTKLFGITFLGKPRTENAENAVEPHVIERIGIAIPVFLCIFIGIYPYRIISALNAVIFYLTGGTVSSNPFSAVHIINARPFSLYAPALIAIAFAAASSAVFLYLKIFSSGKKRIFETWACGLDEKNSKAQYSGGGFSSSIMKVFSSFYSSVSEINFEKDVKKYFRTKSVYTEEINDIFEKYIYIPAEKLYLKLSEIFNKAANSENINVSLGYLFLSLIVCFIIYIFIIR